MVCSGVASLTIWSRYANFKALLLFISLELIVFTVIEYENIYLNSGTKAGFPLANNFARSDVFPLSLRFRLKPSGINRAQTKEKSRFARKYSLVENRLKVVYTFMLVKGTVSPPERCDLFHVKVGTFQVCRICGKGVLFYNQGRR